MRFRDFLRVSVLLFGGAATGLALVSVLGAADEETNTLVYVAASWWCLATLAGLWLGRRLGATPGIARLLSEAQRTQIEEVANEAVQADYAVNTFNTGLDQAKAMGARLVLLITGNPRPVDAADRGTRRGAIRAKVLDWLAAGPHGADVAAVRPAHRRHGGAGALYLVLRRRR